MATELALQTAHTAAWKAAGVGRDGELDIDAPKLVAELFADGWIHAGNLAPLITALIADPHRTDHVVDINLEQEPGPVTHHPITERFNIGQCPFAGLPDSAFTDVDWPDQAGRYRLTTDGTTIRFEPLT